MWSYRGIYIMPFSVVHSIQGGLLRQANLNHNFPMGFYNMFFGKDSQTLSHQLHSWCGYLFWLYAINLQQSAIYLAQVHFQGCSQSFAGWPCHTFPCSLTIVAHQLCRDSFLPQVISQASISIQNETTSVPLYLLRQYSSSSIRPHLMPH